MKLAHLFISICFASAAFSQVPTSIAKDSLAADSIVFDYAAETDPEFPGGYDKLLEYIINEIQFAEVEKWLPTQQYKGKNRVIVKFAVEMDGSVSLIQIDKSSYSCPPCEKEAIRVIQQMPKWKPGKNYGKLVNVFYNLPVTFQLMK
jgi:protein TonB